MSTYKGWIKNNESGDKMSFQYNPTVLSYSRGVTYADISAPGMPYPLTQYVKGNVRTFPVDLFFYDSPNTGAIKKHIKFFEGLVPPEDNSVKFTRPPTVTFCYGYFIRKCVVENLTINIDQTDSSGEPIQALISLQLRQVGL